MTLFEFLKLARNVAFFRIDAPDCRFSVINFENGGRYLSDDLIAHFNYQIVRFQPCQIGGLYILLKAPNQ